MTLIQDYKMKTEAVKGISTDFIFLDDEWKKIEWQANWGPQTEALARDEDEIFYGGSRGGGKTAAGMAWLIDAKYIQNKNYRALIIRKNADDLSDWVDRAKDMYSSLNAEHVGKPGEFRFSSGAIFRLGHLKDEDAYTKYQGHEYHKLLLEEVTQIPTEERYLKLASSVRSTVPGLWPQIFLTGNPGGLGHAWVKRRFIDTANLYSYKYKDRYGVMRSAKMGEPYVDPITKKKRIFVPSKIEDNPVLMKTDPSYVNWLEGLPPDLRRAWREGDWGVFAGQFFNEWRDDIHVKPYFPIPVTFKKFGCLDYGSTNPFAFYWVAIDWNGDYWVYREYYASGKTAEENAKAVVALNGEDYLQTVVGDRAIFAKQGYGETIADILMRNGIGKGDGCIPFLEPSMGGPGSRIAGAQIFRQKLAWGINMRPKMFFFPNCKNAIRTIPELIHDERNLEDVDTTGEDHSYDSIRMLLQKLEDVKVEKPPTGVEQKLKMQKQNMIASVEAVMNARFNEEV